MASTTTAPHPVRPIVLLGAAAVAMVVVVVTSVAAADGRVGPVERSLFEAVNGLRDGLLVPRWVPQLAGVTGTAVVVALVAVWRRWLLAGALVLLVPGKLLAARAVPTMPVHRERPGVTVPGAVLRDAAAGGLSFRRDTPSSRPASPRCSRRTWGGGGGSPSGRWPC